jgi:ketosteroid isomerase-like protein
MKKILIILSISLMAIAACQQKPKTVPVDIKAEETAVNDRIDKLLSAMKAQDVATLTSFLTEDIIGCGSDPSEFWNKQQITDLWTQMLADTSPEINNIGMRVIKVSADGNSAIAIEQYFMPMYTPNIPFRNVYHFVKTNNNWMIDFFSTALIPKNEDLPKLNKALE